MMDDSKTPFFSVVIAAYNCERYILETLRSVYGQTFSDYEVVIVDDASTDDTRNVIDAYIMDKKNWRLYQNDSNSGVAQSRNRGFALAEGRHIAILDGDDVWYSSKLEQQYQMLKNDDVQLCYSSYSFIDGDSRKLGGVYKAKPIATYNMLLKENFIGCSTAAFAAKIAEEYKMDPAATHEDYLFWLTILRSGYTAKGIMAPLVSYRIHSGGRSADKAKASKSRFDIYYRIEKLGLMKSLYYFFCYASRALKKYAKLFLSGLKRR